jgi:DNA-binding transcriptional MerR regulator
LKVSREELSKKLEISQKELDKWIENKLITPIKESGDSFTEQALLYGEVVKNFLSMGYSYKEITKIKNEIGLPLKKNGIETAFAKSQLLTVGELADKGGVNTRTIKFWEEKGLINPFQRTEGGFRLYRTQDILLVKFIKDLQTFNYTLSEIGNIIHLVEQEFSLGNDMSSDVTPEELEKIASGLEYLINYMKEARKASYRVEAVFNRRLKAVLKLIKYVKGSAH